MAPMQVSGRACVCDPAFSNTLFHLWNVVVCFCVKCASDNCCECMLPASSNTGNAAKQHVRTHWLVWLQVSYFDRRWNVIGLRMRERVRVLSGGTPWLVPVLTACVPTDAC